MATTQTTGSSSPPASPFVETISGFPRIHTGDIKHADDPFAAQREEAVSTGSPETKPAMLSTSPPKGGDRRLSSDEWDASKTPPSRFQQRKGSVYATPNSRDGHVDKNVDRDAAYHAKLVEKGWAKITGRRSSKGEHS